MDFHPFHPLYSSGSSYIYMRRMPTGQYCNCYFEPSYAFKIGKRKSYFYSDPIVIFAIPGIFHTFRNVSMLYQRKESFSWRSLYQEWAQIWIVHFLCLSSATLVWFQQWTLLCAYLTAQKTWYVFTRVHKGRNYIHCCHKQLWWILAFFKIAFNLLAAVSKWSS